MRTIAIIPARAGSKGIPHKNMAMLNGRPLIGWTIEAAKKAKLVDHIIVSTNDKDVIRYANEAWGVRSFMRPEELCQDDSPTEDAIHHVLETWAMHHPELPLTHAVLMQATSPIRYEDDVDNMVKGVSYVDSMVSVTEHHGFIFRQGPLGAECVNYPDFTRPMRQQMEQWQGNGSMWAFSVDNFRKYRNRLGGKVGLYVMAEETQHQIDSPYDLWLVEQIMKRNAKPEYDLLESAMLASGGVA